MNRLLFLLIFCTFSYVLSNTPYSSLRDAIKNKGLKTVKKDVSLISSSRKGLSIRVDIKEKAVFQKQEPVGTGFFIDGFDEWIHFGKPVIPFRIISFAAPYGARIGLSYTIDEKQALLNRFKPQKGGNIIDSPRIKRIKQGETVQVFNDSKLYGQRVIQLIVFPVKSIQGKGYEFAKKMTINVHFDGGSTAGRYISVHSSAETQLEDMLLNYKDGLNWRMLKAGKPAEDVLASSSVWYQITVRDTIPLGNQVDDYENYSTGLYGYTYSSLKNAGLPVDQIDLSTLKIYTCTPQDLPQSLPSDTVSEKGLIEIPIYLKDNGDGRFSNGEYFIFFAQTPWHYEQSDSGLTHCQNLYTDNNVYWLTWGGGYGRRIGTIDGSPKSGDIQYPKSNFLSPVMEKAWYLFIGDEMAFDDWWVIKTFTQDYVTNYKSILRGVDVSGTGSVGATFGLGSASLLMHPKGGGDARVIIQLNGTTVTDTTNSSIVFHATGNVKSFIEGSNQISIEVIPDMESKQKVHFSSFDIFYPRLFKPYHDRLTVFTEGVINRARYKIKVDGYTTSDIKLWRVTDPINPVLLSYELSGSNPYAVTFSDSMGLGITPPIYCIYEIDKIKSPFSIAKYEPIHLRDKSNGADYIIISPPEFLDAVKPLVDEYNAKGIKTKLISTDQVNAEFGWGKPDVVAIRNLIWYAYSFWSIKPKSVLLAGAGNANYKNHLDYNKPNRVLVYEDVYPVMSEITCIDDWFGYIEGDMYEGYMSVAISRIPAATLDEIKAVVAKTLQYNKKGFEQYGSWCNTVIITADDYKRTGEGGGGETEHTADSEKIAERNLPKGLFKTKVYETEYPLIAGQKPGANADLIKAVNKGALLWTYLGHGGPNAMSHEKLFKFDDVNRLISGNKVSLFYGGSCQISEFDYLPRRALGEMLVLKADGGCMATVAATRGTYPSGNYMLISNIISYLFDKGFNDSCAQGVAYAKNKTGIQPNTQLYVFFGDGMFKFAYPKPFINLTSYPDTMTEGTRTSFGGNMISKKPGFVYMELYDSVRRRHYEEDGDTVSYWLPRTYIYRGFVKLDNNGNFNASCYIPYGINPGPAAKVVLYGAQDNEQASAFRDSILLRVNSNVPTDTIPPVIKFVRNGQSLHDGDKLPSKFNLEAKISDAYGLNITKLPGKQMLLTVDGDKANRIDITDYFSYDFGSFTSGRLSYPVNLAQGKHTLEIRAFDTMGNEADASITIETVSSDNISLSRVLNYPNPVKNNSTYFTFFLSNTADVEIKILTVRSRLIKTIKARGKEGYNQIPWDCRDNDGDNISNGVYFYKITASGESGKTSVISKLIMAK